jgi:hypothetical protein
MERRSALSGLLALASLATAGVAAWLLVVSVTVLPARDPGQVVMWRLIAVAFLAYSGACWARTSGISHAALRAAVLLLSMAACAFGVYAITRNRDEGYLLLMGVILCGHALLAVVHEIRSTPPRPAARRA